jgi:hypothetical protein
MNLKPHKHILLAGLTGAMALCMATGQPTLANKPAAKLTAIQVIERVDKNQIFGTRQAFITMRIKQRGRIRVKKIESFSKGAKTSYMKFTYPSRDKGVKYLRLNDNLWMYMPSAEKTIKLSGHMLRQSMMGSDFSYEDMLDNGALKDRYHFKIVKMENVGKHKCYVIEMNQKKAGETYPKRKVWVDTKIFVVRKSMMYALSGKLLKVMEMSKVKQFGKRYYTTYMKLQDKLRKGTWTETILTKIKFKVPLDSQIFNVRNLTSE